MLFDARGFLSGTLLLVLAESECRESERKIKMEKSGAEIVV